MSNENRVRDFTQERCQPYCDDCLGKILQIDRHQINQICNMLVKIGHIKRSHGHCSRCGESHKLTNLTDSKPTAPSPTIGVSASAGRDLHKPWYWEGNVQQTLVEHLVQQGYRIRRVANTSTREPGTDVVAEGPEGRELHVSVKGWPESSQNVQARHWFAGALFDIILYWEKHGEACDLAIALPGGYATYRTLSSRVGRLRRTVPLCIYWIAEDGSVSRQEPVDAHTAP